MAPALLEETSVVSLPWNNHVWGSCLQHRPEACPQLITAHLEDLLASRTPQVAPGQPGDRDVAERLQKQ